MSTTTTTTTATTFPYARYTSLLGAHSLLLIFTALYIPRTSLLIAPLPEQASSQDKPQHPFLHPLTADPILTLGWLCVGVVACQVWWAGWLKMWWKEYEAEQAARFGSDGKSDAERKIASVEGIIKKLNNIKNSLVSTLAVSVLYYFVIVLFGAPITTHFAQTYLLALLLSLLTVYPTTFTLGRFSLDSDTASLIHRMLWIRLFAEISPKTPYERAIVYPTLFTIVGCWLGAFPLPLDWDRPWQAWPLTPAYGAIAGYILGGWASLMTSATYFLADEDRRIIIEEKKAKELQSNGKKVKGKKAKKTL